MYGIALEGGGAKGSYQVGAWKAIAELGLDIGGVAGTSVGAINGALMLQDSLEEAIAVWSSVAPHQLFDINPAQLERLQRMERLPNQLAQLINYFQTAIHDKGIDTTPLRKMLEAHIDEEKIRKTEKDFGIVTVSLTDRTPLEIFLEEIPQGELVDYILASSRLPIFQSNFGDGKNYLDGGFYNNLPINMLVRRGYKDIIAIMIGGPGIHRRYKDKQINLTVIEPRENLGAVLEFNPARAKTNINLGYFDTMRIFRGYRGQRYYIESVPSEVYFAEIIARLSENEMTELLEKLKMPAGDMILRSIFERFLPLMAKMLKIDKEGNYGDIVLALFERIAQRQKIDRFQVYTFYDFMAKIDFDKPIGPPARSKLVRLLKRSDLLPWSLREEIFNRFTKIMFNAIKER
jgi:NTE family protein